MNLSVKKSSRPGTNRTTAKGTNFLNGNLHSYYTTIQKVLQVVFAIFITSMLLWFTVSVIKDIFDVPEYIPIQHKVKAGETLWSIAEVYKPDDITMQDYMAWVYEKNAHCGDIYPGDVVTMAEVAR